MIRLDDVHAVKLISGATRVQYVPKLHHCIARYSESDRLLGGVLFTDWMGGSVQIHVAGFCKNWMSKALLYLTFHYPFRQLKIKKLIGLVPEWNVVSRNLSLRMGFRIEYTIYDVFNHQHELNGMHLMSMTIDECKWLHMKLPFIEYAPLERTNRIDGMPLATMPTVGMVQ
jgi:hypothetical protein